MAALSRSVSRRRREFNGAASLRAISTLDALIALQGVEDPTERKKRAVAKGRNALDVLDALKLGLLDGTSINRPCAPEGRVGGLDRSFGRCWA